MDATKKRRMEENGVDSSENSFLKITSDDARKIIDRFTPDQLIDILQDAVSRHTDVLDAVRSIADRDVSQRKLFIRGLSCDTSTEGLRSLFSAYGELEEAVVIIDKATGKSKGYGFVTFKHVDGAILALKEPSKTIDGRVTVTQLAAVGISGQNSNAADMSLRKIYVANVPMDMPADKLLAHFSLYGEIEEGPLGFDKQTGKCRGYALFVYKKPEGAQAALVDPIKTIDGRQLSCKFANDGKKGKPGGGQDGIQTPGAGQGNLHGDGMPMAPPSAMPGSGGQYGGPGGMGSYGGFSSGVQGGQPLGHHPLNSSMGPGLSSVGGQAPSSLGSSGGYGGGPYGGGYGGPASSIYGGMGSVGGGLGGSAGGLGGTGGPSSLYSIWAPKSAPSTGGNITGATCSAWRNVSQCATLLLRCFMCSGDCVDCRL
ncbi:UBP1-associated protein 2C, partial [Cucurbita argyrosperma subsp. sororia]